MKTANNNRRWPGTVLSLIVPGFGLIRASCWSRGFVWLVGLQIAAFLAGWVAAKAYVPIGLSYFAVVLYYAYLPLNINYTHPLNEDIKLLLLGGPRLSIGLFGETNEHYYLSTQAQNQDKSPFGKGNAMTSTDFALGVGAGIEVSNFQFMLGYDLPLSNSSNDGNPTVLRQHNFRFSMAYLFRKPKDKTIIR